MRRENQLGTKPEERSESTDTRQPADIWKMRRAQFLLVVATAAALPLFFCRTVPAAEPASQWSFAEMDKMSGVKGWNFRFPPFGDTLTLDYGGWRSGLALFTAF